VHTPAAAPRASADTPGHERPRSARSHSRANRRVVAQNKSCAHTRAHIQAPTPHTHRTTSSVRKAWANPAYGRCPRTAGPIHALNLLFACLPAPSPPAPSCSPCSLPNPLFRRRGPHRADGRRFAWPPPTATLRSCGRCWRPRRMWTRWRRCAWRDRPAPGPGLQSGPRTRARADAHTSVFEVVCARGRARAHAAEGARRRRPCRRIPASTCISASARGHRSRGVFVCVQERESATASARESLIREYILCAKPPHSG
jgi:hypothetical protein